MALKAWQAALIAVVSVTLTFFLRLAIDAPLSGRPTLEIFSIPIMISAYLGGIYAGMLATTLSLLIADYYFLPPFHSWSVASAGDRWQLGFIVVAGVVISCLNEAMHRARRREELANQKSQEAEAHIGSALKDNADLREALNEHAIVAITNAKGKITFVNEKFCAISKYSRAELIGQDHRIINSGHHTKEFFRTLWDTITEGGVWHGEIKNRAKDGSYYWVDTTIVPFLDPEGKPRQYIAIRADISERKRIEQEVLELNVDLEKRVAERTEELQIANKELESFSYSVSHDLRAPLRAVDGFSQAVIEDYGSQLPEEGQRYLKTIRSGAQKMGALIDDLLTFSRLHRLPIRSVPTNTEALVRGVLLEILAGEGERSIKTNISNLQPSLGDPALLKQVWTNLLSNALKYTRKRSPALIDIGSQERDGETVYFVRDNGTGFDMRYVDKLFGVFQRLHRVEDYEGTGVGLAIVQRIVHRHGGRVWAEGVSDQGATFYFTLSRNPKP